MPPAAGVLATLRTAVLATAAVLLACARRYERTAELGKLLYPVLWASGLKLLLEDFRYSEPAVLFVALGLFGAALVATARLVKRGAQVTRTHEGILRSLRCASIQPEIPEDVSASDDDLTFPRKPHLTSLLAW